MSDQHEDMTISGAHFGWKNVLVIGFLVGSPQALGENFGEVSYRSKADDSMQSAMFYDPKAEEPAPLVVALWGRAQGHPSTAVRLYAGPLQPTIMTELMRTTCNN